MVPAVQHHRCRFACFCVDDGTWMISESKIRYRSVLIMLAVQKPRFPILIKLQRELQFSRWQFPVNKDAPAFSKRQNLPSNHMLLSRYLWSCVKRKVLKKIIFRSVIFAVNLDILGLCCMWCDNELSGGNCMTCSNGYYLWMPVERWLRRAWWGLRVAPT